MPQNFPSSQRNKPVTKIYQEPFSDHLKFGRIHRNPVTQLQMNNYLQVKDSLQVDAVQQFNQPPSSLLSLLWTDYCNPVNPASWWREHSGRGRLCLWDPDPQADHQEELQLGIHKE